MKLRASTLIVLSSICVIAQAGTDLGPSIGWYRPLNAKMRNALGSSWARFGIGPVSTRNVASSQQVNGDWQILSVDKFGNRALLIAATFGTRMPLSSGNGSNAVQPYIALRAGPAYLDYAIGSGASRIEKKRFGWNINAEAGLNVSNAARISVRYDRWSRHNNFNFDGVSLNLSFKVGSF